MSFDNLGLHEGLTRALTAAGYAQPTSVQAEAIPASLAGKDLMVSSRTGSGKTASFILAGMTMVLKARAAKAEPKGVKKTAAKKPAAKKAPAKPKAAEAVVAVEIAAETTAPVEAAAQE